MPTSNLLCSASSFFCASSRAACEACTASAVFCAWMAALVTSVATCSSICFICACTWFSWTRARAADDRSITALERPTDAGQAVRRLKVHLRAHLVDEIFQGDVVALDVLLGDFKVGALAERAAYRRLEVNRFGAEVGAIGGIDLGRPVRVLGARDDQPLERQLGVALGRLRGDERLAPRRLLRLRLDDVDRRHGPDLDARLVVLD